MDKLIKYFKMVSLGMIFIAIYLPAGLTAEKDYPNKPITIVVPWAAAGGVDMFHRVLAQEMQNSLGHPVLVDCRPGGSGILGTGYVVNAKPDGYTIAALQTTCAVPEIYTHFRKAPYTSKDLRPAIRTMVLIFGLVTRGDAPWNNMQEFIKYGRENPKKVKFAHYGIGQPLHVLAFALSKKNNLEMLMVPFKGAGEANIALLGGHIDLTLASVASVKGFVQSGRMKVLALNSPSRNRIPSMPEIPTLKELGFDPGILPHYNTLAVPKETPDEIVKKIHDTVKNALESPSIKKFTQDNAIELYYGSEKDILEEMKRDIEITGPLLEEIQKYEK